MKIGLIQPNLDEKYSDQRHAYSSEKRPPETGLAVLGSWLKRYSASGHEVVTFNPDRPFKSIVNDLAGFDFLGISDWFSNHENGMLLAEEIKSLNPSIKIIVGGPNASMIPREILANHASVDYVVSRDGEDALTGLVEGKPLPDIPNLWHRDGSGNIVYTYRAFASLKNVPVWDFSDFQDVNERLAQYLEVQNSGSDPWLTPPLTLFSFRGCMKAIKEGVCSYCASAEEQGRALPAEKLWEQVLRLNDVYGAEIFYMADDIFSVTPRRIGQIARSKPTGARSRIRAYGYLPDMAQLDRHTLETMARNLQHIGVFNLFFGSEHYDQNVLAAMNKIGTSVEESARVIKTLYEIGGVRTTIAYLLGLPRESEDSLAVNLESLERLLKVDDCIERLYISIGMPLKGTPWYRTLESDARVATEYKQNTKKDLTTDDYPDYPLLSRLSLKYTTSVSPSEIQRYLKLMVDAARKKMPDYRVGGFMLDLD
ncbi:MAG: cobalamin-dependent protein [Candidatus Aenigmatarchaeota archaeon]